MKSIFAFIHSIILFTCCISFIPEAHANEFSGNHSFIMTIDTFNVDKKNTLILLDNGTLWKYKDVDLFDGPNGWQIGDRIEIMYIHYQGYFLQNKSYQGCVPVELQKSKNLNVFTIQSIVKDVNSIDPEHPVVANTIILDDGTEWHIGSWSSKWMEDWTEGDKVLVTPHEFLFGNAEHLIINLNKKLYDSSSCASNVRAELKYSPKPLIVSEDLNLRECNHWNISLKKLWIANDKLVIELDNKMIWECEHPKLLWKCGDLIDFSCYSDEGYKIYNARNKETIKGKWTNKGSGEIQSLLIQSISKKGQKVVLNDGSVWLFGSSSHWNKGDHVVVSPKESMSQNAYSHCLLNLDKNSSKGPDFIEALLIK